MCCLEIQDNGPGMDEKTRRRIFEPFFTTKTKGKGTGLGLYISNSIIKQHGGLIQVSSIKGKETDFKIVLPDKPGLKIHPFVQAPHGLMHFQIQFPQWFSF